MTLPPDKIDLIRQEIERHTTRVSTLRDDLLDHLCCVIEQKIEKGKPFDDSFRQAMNELAPNGLEEIENETLYLLNHSKLILMKKMLFFSGALFSVLFSAGFFLRLMHWSLGDQFTSIGILGLLLIFLPLFVLHYFRSQISVVVSERMKFILGFLSLILVGIGSIMKLNHLPGADMSLVFGGVVFTFGFLPFLFYRLYKKSVAQ